MPLYTADICDTHDADVRTTDPVFTIYGERLAFGGPNSPVATDGPG